MDDQDSSRTCDECGSTMTHKRTRETEAESALSDNAESQYTAPRWVCDADPTHKQQGVSG